MWLTRLSITRPVTILMLVLALIILGLQSRSRLPVDLYPDISFPMLFISTVYPGTGPEEIETLLTKPIEDQVSTISGLKKLSSTSMEGVSNVMMEFEIGTDLDVVTADVRSKVDALRNALPEDAKAPVVSKLDVKAIPVIQLSISSARRPSQEVRRIAEDVLKDQLSQIPGVASVSVTGGDVREVQVNVDKARLEAYGVNIAQVVNALQTENLNLPSGAIDEELRNYAVRVMGEFTNPEQIKRVRIPNAMGNANLTVGDIAVVRDTLAEPSVFTRMNSDPSVSVTVQKASDGNTVQVVDEVKEKLDELTGKPFSEKAIQEAKRATNRGKKGGEETHLLPADLEIGVGFDQSTFIKDALNDVYKSLAEGALLAVLIVFLFLHSIRGTFIVALAIPTSMIATFMIMDALGFSINMMSMLGLSLCVGILVDDSIVVLENIHRHLRMGESPREAALNGRTEIGLAAMTITLVDVVVFVPIAFMGGIVGQFFKQFGIVIATATLFSLFISFTLTPMLASRWLKSHDEEEAAEARAREHPGFFQRLFNALEVGYLRLDGAYRHVLAWALDHRMVVICMGMMALIASVASVMPKPEWMRLLAGLPVLLLTLAVLAGLWYAVQLTRGTARWILGIVGFPVTTALAAMGGMQSKVGTPMIVTLMIVFNLALMALLLSLTKSRQEQGSIKSVSAPLAYCVALVCVVCLIVPTKFSFEFQPKVDERQFSIKVEQEVGTSLNVTDATAQALEADLLNPEHFPDTKTVVTTVGSSGGGHMSAGGSGSDTAQLDVELRDLDDLGYSGLQKNLIQFGLAKSPLTSTDEVIEQVNAKYGNTPGVKITAAEEAGGPGGAPVSIEVSGADMRRIQRAANEIAEILKKTPGTYATELSWREGRPELQARIDRDRAAQYGISVAQIAAALRTSLEGDTSTKYREGGKEYDIRVFLPEEQRNVISQVPSMVVGTYAGRPVYLYEVVDLQPAGGPTKVERVSRQRAVTVSCQLKQGTALGNLQQEITPAIDKLDLNGVTVNWAGQAEFMQESFEKMGSALMLSIALVFMLMAALFESILSPLIIMLSVPQAMAGGLFALSITQKSLSIISMIGFIMLVGLVTKNAILLVDYTNTLRREEGMDRRSALKQAGPTRLRPILMTTLAMIFGMLPTAVALSRGAEMRQPMAITVIGGLLLALFLTLLMVPVFYEIMDNVGQAFGRAKDAVIRVLRI